jgi:argininosuccinate synthase
MALALSRPLIAQKLVEIAGIERADAVAHTGHATGGASRLDRLIAAIAPTLAVMTPAREWAYGDADLLAFARAHGIGATDDSSKIESNFWGRSVRGPVVTQSALAPRPPDQCPAEPAFVDIAFARGVPATLNGVPLPLPELVASLGTLAAAHGVGHTRADGLVCDAPAAVLLHAAHRELTRVASPAELEQFSVGATAAYVDLVEGSRWFSPLREALDAYFSSAQARVNGHVRLRLLKGEHATINSELSRPAAEPSVLRLVPSSTQH